MLRLQHLRYRKLRNLIAAAGMIGLITAPIDLFYTDSPPVISFAELPKMLGYFGWPLRGFIG